MMQLKKLPIGISDFKKLISEGFYYIDKTLLIKDIVDSGAAVTLFPRPRRFGKTLNMTMLRDFFENSEQSNAHLFADLAVARHADIMAHQGKHPVIFLSFKEAKGDNWQECWSIIKDILDTELKRFFYLLESPFIDNDDKNWLKEMLAKKASQLEYQRILFRLSNFLYAHHKIRPIILIDEYDASINQGYIKKYYDDVINFMRGFLSAGLKDNASVQFAVMTGILRLAKESIFSGLNNLLVCTMLSNKFSDKFGLLESEVLQVVKKYQIKTPYKDIQDWYNGYSSGKTKVYNPWSIINFVYQDGILQPYWINTSSNDIIKELVKNTSAITREHIEILISGGKVRKDVVENMVFGDIFVNEDALFNFFLLSGYLTFSDLTTDVKLGDTTAVFYIPNAEVLSFFRQTVLGWFKQAMGNSQKIYLEVVDALSCGNVQKFAHLFQELVADSLSYFDISGKNPENFYHAFVLGMLVQHSDHYQVISNRESGYGRYDVMLIPKNKTKLGVILEFKKVAPYDNETLETAAQRALDQIVERNYAQSLRAQGVAKILQLGVAFEGKQLLVKAQDVE